MPKHDRSAQMVFRAAPQLREVLEQAAVEEDRELSGQIRKILVDWAADRLMSRALAA
jgi:hypothetical protein